MHDFQGFKVVLVEPELRTHATPAQSSTMAAILPAALSIDQCMDRHATGCVGHRSARISAMKLVIDPRGAFMYGRLP
jgi:hypothetical protein